MAYRFNPNASFESGFRRITKEQIAKAHKYLAFNDDHATSVHETRKSLKRLRALLRLFRPALGKSDFAHENARYRDIGRMLSTSRDHQVMLDVIDSLINTSGPEENKPAKSKKMRRALSEVRTVLVRNMLDPDKGADGARIDMAAKRRAIAMLDDAQHELGVLRVKGSGFSIASRGLRREYRLGVKAYTHASESRDDEVFHEWRKCVQVHWRHMSLLQDAWPEYFRFRTRFAKELSDILGCHNDLGMVASFIRGQPSEALNPKTGRKVCKLFKRRQKLLRAQALTMGSKLFADDPDDFVLQIERYWRLARHNAAASQNAPSRNANKAVSASPFSAAKLFKLPDSQ